MDELVAKLQSISRTDLSRDEDSRVKLLAAAQGLCQRLETPWEWVQRNTFQDPAYTACMKVADDIELFKHMGSLGNSPKTTSELAQLTKTCPVLLKRVLRHLAGRNTIKEVLDMPDSYAPTHISEALIARDASAGIRHVSEVYSKTFNHLPTYLESIDYTVPCDKYDGNFQHGVGQPGQSMFEWFQQPENKQSAEDFNDLMQFTTKFRPSWMNVCPVHELIKGTISDEDPHAPLLVDIGGGSGTDVLEFRRRFPKALGCVELQELPMIIEAARKNGLEGKDISLRAHDFFSPQPVRHARIYYMGSILHDWPDVDVKKILGNIAPAMKKDYSKLMLNDNVLPETGCHPHLSALDLTMMTLLSAKERTEEQWRELISDAGLKVVEIHKIPSCFKSVLEVELA